MDGTLGLNAICKRAIGTKCCDSGWRFRSQPLGRADERAPRGSGVLMTMGRGLAIATEAPYGCAAGELVALLYGSLAPVAPCLHGNSRPKFVRSAPSGRESMTNGKKI